MISALANIFGYLLEFLYNIFNNYGWSIVIFSVLTKLLLIPLTLKQQKTMEATSRMQEEMNAIQFKYKGDQEKMNQEMMALYKRENITPFSGCLSSIAQIILIFAVFYMVRSPLTYVKKVNSEVIKDYTAKLEQKTNYPEVEIIKEFGDENEEVYFNMDFLGLDLRSVPVNNLTDIKTLIIPILYVISSIASTKLTLNMQTKKNKEEEKKDGEEKELSQEEMLQNTSKTMTYMMPIMAVSISLAAPLGLGLYWLMSNILMIVERLLLNRMSMAKKEEA